MRIDFSRIFKTHPDGSIEPLRPVRISGVRIGPGVRLGPGVRFGGIDLSLYAGKELEVEEVEESEDSSVVGIYG